MNPARLALHLMVAVGTATLLRAASVACASASSMNELMDVWTRGYTRLHPRSPAEVTLRARFSAEAFGPLLRGDVQAAAFARELFPAERRRYVAIFGRPPALIPVALGSRATKGGTHAIAIFVNARNPLRRISMAQLAAVFSGAVSRWGQLGLGGPWADRPITVHGMAPLRTSGNPPGIVNYLEERVLHGDRWRRDLVVHTDAPHGPQALVLIVRAVAADEGAIGYSGFGYAEPGVRTLAVGATAAGPFFSGSAEEVRREEYPLTRRIYLCLRGAPAAAARAFVAYVLGPAGQAEIRQSPEGFFPLPRADVVAAQNALTGCVPPHATASPPAAPAADPPSMTPPAGASYREPGGAIAIVGYNDMKPMLEAIDRLFEAAEPEARFDLRLRGTATAAPALAHGVTLLAPIGTPFSRLELVPYEKLVGAPPLVVRVARATPAPGAKSGPLVIIVHPSNLLARITLDQVARVFGVGAPNGDIGCWDQLGVPGVLASRSFHRYGLAEDTALGRELRGSVLHGRCFAPDLETARESTEVVARVASDAAGIGFASANAVTPAVKVLAVARTPLGPFVRPTAEAVAAGAYPLERFLYLALRHLPGAAPDPMALAYAQLALSPAGQAAIGGARPGYLPLLPTEAAAEAAKLRKAVEDATRLAGPPVRFHASLAPASRPAAAAVGYITADGAVRIVGNDGMEAMLTQIDRMFARLHPGARFQLVLKGSSTGLGGLAAGISALAPMGRSAWPFEIRPFVQAYGYPPTDIRIGRDGFAAPGRKNPPAVYVHASNPLPGLTLAELAQIFTRGSAHGDITRWAQVRVGGAWAARAIHVYGLHDDGGFATGVRVHVLGGGAFVTTYEALPKAADVLRAVAADPDGIGLVGFFPAEKLPPTVRLLPLATRAGAPYVQPDHAAVAVGEYPLVPYLHVYVNRAPGRPLDPLVRDYVRLLLSPAGQAVIATQKEGQGYVPLPPAEVATELGRLD